MSASAAATSRRAPATLRAAGELAASHPSHPWRRFFNPLLVLGLLIVGLAESMDKTLNYPKIGVKLVLGLVVVAMAEIGNARSRKGQSAKTQLDAAGGAGLLAALVAALW